MVGKHNNTRNSANNQEIIDKIDPKCTYSLQPINQIHIQDKSNTPQTLPQTTLPDCLKPITLYDGKNIFSIPSESIEIIYHELGPKEGTTLHKAFERNIGFLYTFRISLSLIETSCILFEGYFLLGNTIKIYCTYESYQGIL